jgi:GWxTD domain-containing protein
LTLYHRWKKICLVILLGVFFPGVQAAAGPGKSYGRWLDLVHYIITPAEKKVFLALDSDNQRDAFINLFWKLRDPSRETPQNEFKDQHIKRFNYANRYFKYGSPLPGWKTDRGRIYILLGPPVNREEINASALRPMLIWEYAGDVEKALPPVFRIVFYKKNRGDDYRLYVPAVDGPAALLRAGIGEIDPHNYYQVYKAIHDAEPAAAEVSLSLVPGERLMDYSPSLQSPILISTIHELPQKKIDTNYARNFPRYKGIVETGVITDYISLKSDLYVLRDPVLDLNFVHFALRPDRVSVDYLAEKDCYYTNFQLMVFLKKGDADIYKYTREYPFYAGKKDAELRFSHGIIVTGYFPIVEAKGEMTFIAILQNSTGKELGYFETVIDTGGHPGHGPRLFGPLVSYYVNRTPRAVYSAFNVMDIDIKADPARVFAPGDELYSFFSVQRGDYTGDIKVELEVRCPDKGREFLKTHVFDFTGTGAFRNFTPRLVLPGYGNYLVTARIKGRDGGLLDERQNDFQVSPLNTVVHPPMLTRTLKKEKAFIFYIIAAGQYRNLGDAAAAKRCYRKASQLKDAYAEEPDG